jgi:hypothetical protein
MSDTKTDQDRKFVRVALQRDGRIHLVSGVDWLRSFCGIHLALYTPGYTFLHRYGAGPHDCRQCAAIVDQRVRFPESSNEELRPVLDRIT